MCDETSDSEAKKKETTNEERLGECLGSLRKYLETLAESAEIDAKRSRLEEQREQIEREEEMLREEQYPCDEYWMLFYEDDFRFEWM